MRKNFFIVSLVVVLLLALAVPAFAQSTTTLDITTDNITPNLFLGANIMITALLAVMMLIAGFGFGLMVLKKIVSSVSQGIR
jgi:hypothetical protein